MRTSGGSLSGVLLSRDGAGTCTKGVRASVSGVVMETRERRCGARMVTKCGLGVIKCAGVIVPQRREQ